LVSLSYWSIKFLYRRTCHPPFSGPIFVVFPPFVSPHFKSACRLGGSFPVPILRKRSLFSGTYNLPLDVSAIFASFFCLFDVAKFQVVPHRPGQEQSFFSYSLLWKNNTFFFSSFLASRRGSEPLAGSLFFSWGERKEMADFSFPFSDDRDVRISFTLFSLHEVGRRLPPFPRKEKGSSPFLGGKESDCFFSLCPSTTLLLFFL